MAASIVNIVPDFLKFAVEDLGHGKSAVQLAATRTSLLAQELSGDCFVVGNSASFEKVAFALPQTWINGCYDEPTTVPVLLNAIYETLPEGSETVVVTWLDQPFVDAELTRRLVKLHSDWWCDYTFADGYPVGFSAEVLRRDAIPAILSLAENVPAKREFLFETIQKDINAFDIETEVSEEDYRPLRVVLAANSRRNFRACSLLGSSDGVTGDEILRRVQFDGLIQRSGPAWYDVQVTNRFSQDVTYEPWGKESDSVAEMSADRFGELMTAISAFSPAAPVSIGYAGEPALHSEIVPIVQILAQSGNPFFVETSGVGWTDDAQRALESLDFSRGSLIIFLDADDKNIYQALRGDGYEAAQQFAKRFCSRFPASTYIQATRLPESEMHLRDFYHRWKAICAGVIIEKYNSIAGRLPDRRVADLEPLHRHSCRHLQRDIVVRVDGTVPKCMQDIDTLSVRGNVFEHPLEEIWAAGNAEYRAQMAGEYAEICRGCDEYYTVNA